MAQETLAKFAPSASDPWDRTKAAHLLNRAGFGGRPDEVERYARIGLDAAVDDLMNFDRTPEAFPAPDFTSLRNLWESVARLYQSRASSERERFEARAIALRQDNQKLQEVRDWWLTRMIQTGRPLQERMVLFWHGLLVSGRPDARYTENLFNQNELFRRNALGNFKTLILAVAKDPAMLEYLDNESNRKGRPNENFARELMELFTMGVGNYTEQDVKESARAFTGWTRRGFDFFADPRQHDDGTKTFMGRTGNFDGTDIINIIFEQPATARYLPRRLFEHFAYQRPDDTLVDELAELFRHSNFETAPVVRTILTSNVFHSPRTMRSQVKSPAQLVAGTARLLSVDAGIVPMLVRATDFMGQALFYPPNVGGWPRGDAWINTATILIRYNFAGLLLTGGMPGLARRPAARPPVPAGAARIVEGASTAGEVVDRLVTNLTYGTMDEKRKGALVQALGAGNPGAPFALSGPDADVKFRSALHLLMCSPEYQMA